MTTVETILGEKITGRLIQEDKLHIYIETYNTFKSDEEYQQAVEVFGKEYVDNYLLNKPTVIKLPKDEIKHID